MHIQNRIHMIVKLVLPRPDILCQLLHRLYVQLVNLELLLLPPQRRIILRPVKKAEYNHRKDNAKQYHHLDIQRAAQIQVNQQIQCNDQRDDAKDTI